MALRDVDSESDSTHPVTPMGEIRRHKGMLFDEFTREYPDWEWSERRRRNRLMVDEQGRVWVPMFSPDYGVYFAYDEPGFTPAAEEGLLRVARKARAEIQAGGGVVFDPDEPDD